LDQVNTHVSFSGTIPMATLFYEQEVPSDLLYRYPNVHFDFTDGHYLLSSVPKDNPQFVVGSIPTDDQQFVNKYFDDLISAEKRYSHKTALNGLIAAGIVGQDTPTTAFDCASIGEKVRLAMSSSNAVTLYENLGVKTSAYPFTMPLTEANFTSVWNQTQFDWVYLAGHNAVYSNYWLTTDGIILSKYFADVAKLQKTVFLGVFDGCSSAYVGAVESLAGFFAKGCVSVGLGYTSFFNMPTSSHAIFQKLKTGYSLGDALYFSRKGMTVTDLVTQAIVEEEILGDPSACLIPTDVRVTLSDPPDSTVIPLGFFLTPLWDKTDTAWAYNVQVSKSSGFTDLVRSDIVYTNTDRIFDLPASDYFWRVAGISDSGLGIWSETRTFTVRDQLTLSITPLPSVVNSSEITIFGTTNGDSITINNKPVAIANNQFVNVLSLLRGNNTITITAIKGVQTLVQTYKVFYKTQVTLKLVVGKPTVWINGTAMSLEAPPVIYNSRTLVPIRVLVESIGGSIDWNTSTRTVNITLGDTNLALIIDSSVAVMNNTLIPIDAADAKVVPKIVNGRTMLPLRFIAEALGFQVNWEATTQTITLMFE